MEYKISTEFKEYEKLIDSLVREEFLKVHKEELTGLFN